LLALHVDSDLFFESFLLSLLLFAILACLYHVICGT
jgi:hypothetical protein